MQCKNNNEWGAKLTEASSNKGFIFLKCGIRIALGALILWAGLSTDGFSSLWIGGVVVCLLIAAYPMRHLADKAEYFEHAICYCGVARSLHELGTISWYSHKSSTSLFEDLYMDTDAGRYLFSYIKDGKKQFNRAYRSTLHTKGEKLYEHGN